MVALNNVTQMPFFNAASAKLKRTGTWAKKVPLRYWRMAVMAFALLWACHTLANLVWVVVPSPQLPVPEVTATVTARDSGTGRTVNIEEVAALNLFGDFNAPPVVQAPVEAPPEPVRITQLNVELQGLIAANDASRSWAIIGRANNQQLYRVGDEITGVRGVKIAQIHDLRVVLDNNGTLEELWLYGEDGLNVASAPQASSPRPSPEPPPEDAPQTASISRDQIEQARNIGDVVRFMVATEEGRMIGYKVRPGRKRELFDQVGLQADDVVVSVNGIEVNEPQKVREVYQTLQTASEANLQVMRDGATHFIQITMSSEE